MKIALISLFLAQLADGIFTRFMVGSGVVAEGNHLMAGLLQSGSFLPVKIAGAVLCTSALALLGKRFKTVATVTTLSIVTFYGLVLVWNISTIISRF